MDKHDAMAVRKVCTSVMAVACPRITFKALIHLIKKEFKRRNIELDIRTQSLHHLDVNEFYVNAYYDAEADRQNDCAIEVVVYHHIKNDSSFEHSQIGQFLVQIYDAVVHEFRHREQSRARNFRQLSRVVDETNTKEYLSDPDEVDAYALSIAIELIRNLGSQRSIQYLHRVSRLAVIRPKGLFASPSLFHYFRIFKTVEHPVLRTLIKKIYLNLQALDELSVFY